jgi:hypothetical protein
MHVTNVVSAQIDSAKRNLVCWTRVMSGRRMVNLLQIDAKAYNGWLDAVL